MTQTLLFMIGVLLGGAFIATKTHTTAELNEAIITAYELGQSECPAERICMRDTIGLKRLTVKDVEDIIQ